MPLPPSASQPPPEPVVLCTNRQLKQVLSEIVQNELSKFHRLSAQPVHLTAGQVARRLRLRDSVVLDALRDGTLPGSLVGRTWRILADDADAWFRSHKQDIRKPAP